MRLFRLFGGNAHGLEIGLEGFDLALGAGELSLGVGEFLFFDRDRVDQLVFTTHLLFEHLLEGRVELGRPSVELALRHLGCPLQVFDGDLERLGLDILFDELLVPLVVLALFRAVHFHHLRKLEFSLPQLLAEHVELGVGGRATRSHTRRADRRNGGRFFFDCALLQRVENPVQECGVFVGDRFDRLPGQRRRPLTVILFFGRGADRFDDFGPQVIHRIGRLGRKAHVGIGRPFLLAMMFEGLVVGLRAVEEDRQLGQLAVLLQPTTQRKAGLALPPVCPHEHDVRSLDTDILKRVAIPFGDTDLVAIGAQSRSDPGRELAILVDDEGVLLGHGPERYRSQAGLFNADAISIPDTCAR